MVRNNIPLLGQQNIGPTIAARLKTIGIHTIGDLQAVGPAGVYKQLKEAYPKITLPICYYLYSLQGALDGIHWNNLSNGVKVNLLNEVSIKALPKKLHRD